MKNTLTQVLLIEDNPADVLLLGEALERDPRSSFEVKNVEHLKTALHRIKHEHFDIILLDLNLPDGQGLDAFIKIHQEAPNTPIVILSGLMDEEIAFQAIHLGAQDYLVKGQEAWEVAARTLRYAIERQRSQAALRDSENRFRNLFEHAPVAYLSLDLDGSYLDFNAQLVELLGYSPGEIIGRSFAEQWSPETRATFSRKFTKFIQDGKIKADIQLIKKDGTLIEVLIEGRAQYDTDGQFVQTHSVLYDITARKLAEQALQETQERFSAVFRSNPLGISITELVDGAIVDANESFLNLFGYTRGETLRHTPFELDMWQEPDEYTSHMKLLRTRGEVTNIETTLRKKDGETIHALASYRLIELDGKHYVLNMLNDITDRRQKEQALIDSERRFVALLENGMENISLITADGVLLWESPAVERTLDYGANQFVGQNILELLHPDERERINQQFAELVKKPASRWRDSFRLRHADGTWRWVKAAAINLLSEPSVNAIVVNYHDINEQKQAEEKLRESETRLSTIFRYSPMGIVVTRLEDGRILDANPAFASFHGYTCDEMIGQSSLDLAMWAIPAEREAMAKELREHGTCHEMDIKARKKTGDICSLRISAELIELGGEIVCLGLGQEITERKQAEEKLRENEEKYRSLIESSVSIIATIDHEGYFSFVNQVAAQQLGKQPTEIVGKNMIDLFPPEQAEQQLQRLRQVIETNTGLITESPTVVNGQTRWYQNHIQPIRNRSGQAVLALLNATDITERKQSELELKAKTAEFTALYETTNDLSLELDIPKLLQQIVERTNRLLESSGSFIYLYDQTHNDLVLTVASGSGQPIGMRLKMGEGMAGRVALSHESLIIDDYQSWPSRADVFANQPLRSVVEVPMLSGGELIGVLGLEQYEDSARKFSDQDTHLLALFAGYAAGAVRNARLLNETNLHAQQLSLLYEAGLMLNRELDPQNQLRLLFEIVQRALKADNVVFFRYGDAQREFYIESGVGNAIDAAGISELRFALGEERGVVGWVAQHGSPYYLADAQLDPRWIEIGSDLHSVMWVPVGYEKRLLGVLTVASTQVDAFSKQDQQHVVLFANQVAVAMENARLFAVLQKELSDRKQTEKALRESAQGYRTLIDQTPAIVYIDDSSTNPGRTQFISPYIQSMLGFTPEQWIAGGEVLWRDRLHPADRDRVLAEYAYSIQTGEPLNVEYRLYAADERVVWVHDQATTLRDEAGKPHSVHGVMYDITERKQADSSLRESEQRFRSLFNTSPDAILLIDPHDPVVPWRVLDCNEAACKMNGYTRAELVGQSVAILNVAPETEEERQAYLANLRRKGVVHIESTHRHKNGDVFPIEVSTSLLTLGERELVLGIDRDITERRRTESERQALLQVMEEAGSTTDLAEYLKLVHRSIAKIIWAENFFVILHNKETDQFEEIYSVDQFDPPQPPSKLAKSISAYVFRSGKPLLLTQSVFEELAARGEVELVGTNSPSWLGVPLITPKETIGVMVVQHYENANQYTEGDQDFLTSIAGQVSLAVERIRAETEISHQLSELEALYENGLAISSMFEPRQIAHRIVQVLDQKLKWHHAAVRIFHPKSGQLELLALSQPGLNELQIDEQIERVNQFNINLDYGLSGWVVKHRVLLRSGNLKENPFYAETYPGIKSGLYVPIQSGEEVIGSIAVESEQENAFAERDERLLTTLATQAAISFTNAQLYERLQHELIERRRTEDKILQLNVELERRVEERTLEIEATHQRLELATASSGIGVWELRSGIDTLYWDERMHGIYGTLPEKFIPTLANWLGFVHPDDREAEAEKTSRAIAQPGTHRSEFRIIREDGSVRYVNSHAIVRVDEQHSFKDMIGVHIDITTIKEAEETLRMGNIALERALRMKDEFLANMSHELRTPLNAILGLSESLEEQIIGSLNEKQQRYIHTISESGHHLLTLINDILDLAKIEAGQIQLEINKVDIHAVCQSSLRMIKQLAQKKNQRVEFEIDEKLNLIWGDERRLKQMMVNLLSNAVKFTAAGGQIGLEVHAHEADNQVVITVWDSGIGIKGSELTHLFQPFVQLDAGLARESSGTGLGLALVAQMARLHGGSVSVTSQPGVGSRFMITLPWEPALASDTLSRMKITGKFRVVKPGSESNGQTILLIEDTEEVVMMLKDYLESAAYRVVTAQNGFEGIAQAKKFHPDLILMDVQMPGMDGLEATQRLRSDHEFQNTPIIALTAFAMQNDRERCLAAGMNEYLSKPVNMKTLLKVVQSFLAGG